MKFNYEIIKKNLEIYNEAKSLLPILSEYEKGEVSQYAIRNIGLRDFSDFSDFLKQLSNKGFSPVMNCNWRQLKPLLIEHTRTPRLKKLIGNKTQNQFNSILKDGETFDRFLNGRWVTKPGYSNKGRRTYGRRGDECIESFSTCIVPIINYLIQSDGEVYDGSGSIIFDSFVNQSRISHSLRWYTSKVLDLNVVPKREIDVTRKLLNSFVQIMEDSKIDFRKLNSDYITVAISEKIKNSMSVPVGTMLKCIKSHQFTQIGNPNAQFSIEENKSYEVKSSNISNGFVRVLVRTESGRDDWFDYSNFEDMAFHRDDLLSQLFS